MRDLRTVEQIKLELADAAKSGGDDALRVVWKTITNKDVRKSLLDYLKALKAPKVKVAVEDSSTLAPAGPQHYEE